MPVEGTFQGRETCSTTDWSSQGSVAESFCVCEPCVLEVRWSHWSGSGRVGVGVGNSRGVGLAAVDIAVARN
jgi:hypothetical protein